MNRRRWLRKWPAPPPTPEGMVYAKRWGTLQLVPADEFRRVCAKQFEIVDQLTPEQRKRVHETGKVPEFVTVSRGGLSFAKV
jgi:hypothetical protein